MYTCTNCGNNEWFYYEIKGTEEVRFHPESRDVQYVETIESEQAGELVCSECDSPTVEIDE